MFQLEQQVKCPGCLVGQIIILNSKSLCFAAVEFSDLSAAFLLKNKQTVDLKYFGVKFKSLFSKRDVRQSGILEWRFVCFYLQNLPLEGCPRERGMLLPFFPRSRTSAGSCLWTSRASRHALTLSPFEARVVAKIFPVASHLLRLLVMGVSWTPMLYTKFSVVVVVELTQQKS